MEKGALRGIRVIDLTTILMGPMATRILADHGADVIRVETTRGDSTRNGLPSRHFGMSGFNLNLQRNKRSLSIDLKHEAGRQVILDLVATADVFVTNMRAKALERLGLDETSLNAVNPTLIYCRANGFGTNGPYGNKAAYDDAIQAASGLAGLFSAPNGRPTYVPSVIADKVTGLYVVQAVMAALIHRFTTGDGQNIEVPMFETMVSFNLVEHLRGAAFEPPEGPFGYERLLSPARRPYATVDGHICLLPYTDDNYREFFNFIERPDLAQDERFSTHNARVAHTTELYDLIAEVAATKTSDVWIKFCDEASIPAAKVLDLSEFANDPHLAEVELVQIAQHPTEGAYKYVRDPVTYSESATELRRHAPRLGEHSAELLEELGYSAEQISGLVAGGVVAVSA
ncbi:MAG: CoA transferase [Actinomycetota bacterium]|nr:CoA transferase [Actinomycetota bacterium]